MDALCFHGKADLTGGALLETVTDIEDVGSNSGPGSASARLCIQCPGHGYLFSLSTGDNIVTAPKFVDGRMQLGHPKAVKGMQRVYAVDYRPASRDEGGLWIQWGSDEMRRYASDR